MSSTCLLWMRRDLRLHDHPALHRARAEFDVVVPVFVLDDALLHGRYASSPRARFLFGCLRSLDEQLRERGSGLVLRRGAPEHELPKLAEDVGARAVLWTSDVSPYALRRDAAVTAALNERGVRAVPNTGTYARDVSKVRKADGDAFTVFTPYWKTWERLAAREVVEAPRALAPLPAGLDRGELPGAGVQLPAPVCEPGEPAAREALRRWLDGPVDRYADRHDTLAGGTSILSPYLRWGCLSARECEVRARGRATPGADAWVRQLAWRDFYASVLLEHPENVRREFQPKFRSLAWHDDADALDAWKRGETGFPIVDAGMRQLAATGWMHNRARMVVGSFLTKDLHLDWRAGERHFASLLLDGEPAQNNGNWQWIASTGVDPAPYFRRIFNPMIQQQKFDPDGAYVRRWVPELAAVPANRLAEPWTMTEAEQREARCAIGLDYPAPIVDHADERKRAMDRYREASASVA
ncbi:DNA photolyase family protein [Svornostia abyssi]|uniref:DNA photolyase family protein n=1 Tax=Svornostia abyssi TaxID=2898438 RepID=A0ABY5PNH9_9ACTN|nr:DNA photolyase family protein [Parviterribacteraceae bacterium J379]